MNIARGEIVPARDVVSNLFSTIKENELRNKSECLVIPGSSVSQQILRVMQRFGFIGEFE
ncbi:MAG: 30S ribosomal protein S8, partial [Nitrososphaerota archaeon]|nr:30S ribosomal protein S8 [Nitrososphaerota archaeon]